MERVRPAGISIREFRKVLRDASVLSLAFRYGVPVGQCIGAPKLGDLTIELFEPIEIDAANAGKPVGLSFQSFDEHHRIAFWRLDVPQDLIDQFFGRLQV